MTVDVVLAEDFPLVRDALARTLNADRRIGTVRAVDSGRGALDELTSSPPDVVLLDLHMPDMDGATLIARVRALHPRVCVAVLTACEHPARVVEAIDAGAHGYLLKRQVVERIVDAVVEIAAGGFVVAPQVAGRLVGDRVAPGGVPVHAVEGGPSAPVLSPSDLELVRRVARGQTDEGMAMELFVSTRTVQYHLARIRRLAGVRGRTELACWAMQNELV